VGRAGVLLVEAELLSQHAVQLVEDELGPRTSSMRPSIASSSRRLGGPSAIGAETRTFGFKEDANGSASL
jgi:hypothetical protein